MGGRSRFRIVGWLVLAMVVCGGAASLSGAEPEPGQAPQGLKAGDTLLFLGDSITHQCLYTRYVTLFYMTRYPGIPLHFYNSGVGGDQAADALRRFEYDVAALHPACVTVLLGMNDAHYRPLGEPQFGTYKKNMTRLVERLRRETRARIYLLTPSFYDYKASMLHRGHGIPTYNDALIAFGEFLKKLGAEQHLPVVDMNAPMLEVTRALRRNDPKASIVPGGVHPNPAGHLVMAATILKAFGVTPVVAAVTVDAASGKVTATRARVSGLHAGAADVRFDVREEALPFPYARAVRPVLRVLPFTRELNRETLAVKGLSGGKYRVQIDGRDVGTWDAAALARGVNLADNPKTPEHAQAVRVMALNDRRTSVMRRIRNFRLQEKRKGYPRADGTYPRPLRRRVRKNGKSVWVADPAGDKRFEANRKKLSAWLAQVRKLEGECYKLAQPVVHHVRIRRAD